MREYLEKSVNGFTQLFVDDKLIALLFVAIGSMWLIQRKKKNKVFVYYVTITTIACSFPLSAAFLMAYQTRFYDYMWIWSMVPITVAIAYGLTIINEEIWANGKIEKRKKMIFTAGCIGCVFICGLPGLAKTGKSISTEDSDAVVERLASLDPDANMVWAPREIITGLRQKSGVKVLYGRNMWDPALSAYSYDEYEEQVKDCFAWMEWAQNYDPVLDADREEAIKYLDGVECGNYAQKRGVTVIVLPYGFDSELAGLLDANLGVMTSQIGEYHLIYCNIVLPIESN